MTKSHRNRSFLIGSILPLLVSICLILASQVAFAGKGEAIIRKVQEKFESLNTLSVHFEALLQSDLEGESQCEAGVIYLDSTGRYRTETTTQTIVFDGRSIWMYNSNENQVIIRSAEQGADDLLTPQRLLYEYPTLYAIENVEKATCSGFPCYRLVMVPKEETDPTRQLQVWIDMKEYLTRKFVLEDLAGNVTTFEFKSFQIGQVLPDATFQFTPPEGAEVIDMR